MKKQVGTTTDQLIIGLLIVILFSCSVLAVVCPSARAAGLWRETYGGINDDRALSLVATSDGGYALAGTTDSFGAGGYDFWLVKTERVSASSTFVVLLIVVIAVAVVCFGLIVYFIKIKKKAQ
jgi:hypothetical protein